jgi:predicted transposase/invertase (TIGR01784 family)
MKDIYIFWEVSMKDTFCSPLYNFVFKELFGKKRNLGNTKAFLKTILDIPEDDYDRLTIDDPFLPRWFKKGKEGIVDLKLTTRSGKIIHIELQAQKKANLRDRILFYGARLIGDQLILGDNYGKVHHVVSIVICDHILLEEESSYMNVYELRNENNKSFTDKLKIVILELPKLPEKEDRAVWPWLSFFKCEKKEDFMALLEKYPQLKEVIHCLQSFLLPKAIYDELLRHSLWKADQENIILQAKIDAAAEAKAEAGDEERKKIARNALAEGSSVEFVQKITGLPLETIEKL